MSSCWQPSLLAIAPLLGSEHPRNVHVNLFKMAFPAMKSRIIVSQQKDVTGRNQLNQLSTSLPYHFRKLPCFTARKKKGAQVSVKKKTPTPTLWASAIFNFKLHKSRGCRKLTSLEVGKFKGLFWVSERILCVDTEPQKERIVFQASIF